MRSEKDREAARRHYAKNSAKINAAAKAYYAKNKDKVQEYKKKLLAERPVRMMLYGAKRRAKITGMVFDISVEDIQIPEFCPVLGIKLGRGGDRSNSPSIDRIDNSKGYVKGNVIVISHRANCLKRDATLLEMQRLADFYTRLSLLTDREDMQY